jgi:hypothetical protein
MHDLLIAVAFLGIIVAPPIAALKVLREGNNS